MLVEISFIILNVAQTLARHFDITVLRGVTLVKGRRFPGSREECTSKLHIIYWTGTPENYVTEIWAQQSP